MKRIGAGAETAEECVDEGADLGRVEASRVSTTLECIAEQLFEGEAGIGASEELPSF